MPRIDQPTRNVKYYAINTIYVKADDASVDQYCLEKGITLSDYTAESKRFSNDGGIAYQYYNVTDSVWVTEFGFEKVVLYLDYV